MIILYKKRTTLTIKSVTNPQFISLNQKPTSTLDNENPALLTDLSKQINREKDTIIIVATTDLHEKLPTNACINSAWRF